ncbi:MAG TPA: hypothetical protein DEA97_18125 [Bacteroidales bacterium]|nr:MAG: hypothetical protein UR43_C0009G0002 [candidate division TM6 bacterium GW2011_GWF2_33_332]OFY79216.1 MAG: hypothetical protein A2281_14730 [Bacteroidetes bacterium RIFOXYA12_FULL_38_20]HBS88482.1 hypothetical protein [Bacteroidales bacterium]
MELDKDTLKALIKYLQSHNYPDSTFAIEYKTGKYQIDLAIIDSETNLPVQIFEVKNNKDDKTRKFGREQLKRYLDSLGMIIPAYLVFPKNAEPYFEIERYLPEDIEKDYELIGHESFFNFNFQKQARLSEKIESIKGKKETLQDSFKYVSWIMSLILVLIIVLQKFKLICVEFDTIDLLIIGSSILLIILPFTSSINILGVEIRRLEKTTKKEK